MDIDSIAVGGQNQESGILNRGGHEAISCCRGLLERALRQASEGRRYILRKMLETVSQPNPEISEHALRFEGLCHISELAEGFVDQVSDVIGMGEEIEVVIINVDDRGKVKLSAKQAKEAVSN